MSGYSYSDSEIIRTIFHLAGQPVPEASEIPGINGLRKKLQDAGKLGEGPGQVELIPALRGSETGLYLIRHPA